MATFSVWATLLTEESCNRLVGKLIDSHCEVSPLASNGSRGVMGETACLLAIKVKVDFKNTKPDKMKNKMIEFVKGQLDKLDAHYFSIVVRDDTNGGSTWSGEGPEGRQQ